MTWTRVYDGAAPVRINKWLAQSGVCSRREAEALIAQGLVFVNGARVGEPGRQIAPGEELHLADRAEAQLAAQVSVVINKPVGYVSAQPEAGQVPAARLLRKETLFGAHAPVPAPRKILAPVGRLDLDSRGLLILSEDGVLAKAVIGPDSRVEKEYLVRVAGAVTEKKIALLRHGLALDGRGLKRADVRAVGAQRLRFVLHEGRNRQIRRMCELVELDVTDLLRVRIGAARLGDLPEGRWRLLTADERAGLIEAR